MERREFITMSGSFFFVPYISLLDKLRENGTQIVMEKKICTACGTQMPLTPTYELCPICSDDRQYIPESGQTWTTHSKLLKNTSVRILRLHDRLVEFTTLPGFAIGQRALLVQSDSGNILWDCIPLLTDGSIDFIKSRGGLKAIAISHPHYYSNMNDWADIFNCPIYIHKSDEKWIFNKGIHVTLWEGHEKSLWDNLRIINIGGHFPGSCVLHAPFLSKKGSILCGDTLYLAPNMKHLSVMYSYPNRIPLPVKEVNRIKELFEALNFDSLYGFWSYQNLNENAKDLMSISLTKYI
jgi:hypothetical protein